MQPRIFHLQRDTDITGVSGTGIVAHGVQWPDGTVTIRWTGDRPSTVTWGSIEDAVHVHGHGGHTRIVWADGQPEQAVPPVATLLDLIDSLRDPEPCRLDHHGDCQEHYWFEPGPCPHARAAALFPAEDEPTA
ncbi:hypothetical protein [Kitasatospora sp. NPDC047058]|uniref:hypothetical protein n=1 Tax=Kitasatospora sp. NPDC047058 TaxID=3155620 RepID=UPI0033F74C6C